MCHVNLERIHEVFETVLEELEAGYFITYLIIFLCIYGWMCACMHVWVCVCVRERDIERFICVLCLGFTPGSKPWNFHVFH